jgi:hypothetical protein
MTTELCSICLETLSTTSVTNDVKTTYKLPECGHAYHTECILHWFRAGNCKCPYCSNSGENNDVNNSNNGYYWYETFMTKFKEIKQFAKNKNSPSQLTSKLEKIKQLDELNINLRNEIKELDNTEGLFKEINKKKKKIETKTTTNKRKIFQLQNELVQMYPIQPLIVVTRKLIC